MARDTRLFEMTPAGLLNEVEPTRAAALRAARPVRHMNLTIDILLTDGELAQMAEDAKRAIAEREERDKADAVARQAAHAKLAALGLDPDELKALLR